MTIWESIDKSRVSKGYSIKKLAKQAGISENTIKNWIYCKAIPNVLYLWQVADVLEMSLDELVGRKMDILDKTNKK